MSAVIQGEAIKHLKMPWAAIQDGSFFYADLRKWANYVDVERIP